MRDLGVHGDARSRQRLTRIKAPATSAFGVARIKAGLLGCPIRFWTAGNGPGAEWQGIAKIAKNPPFRKRAKSGHTDLDGPPRKGLLTQPAYCHQKMNEISLRRLLVASIIAALIGSTLGTILLVADDLADHPIRRMIGEGASYIRTPVRDYFFTAPAVWVISLFGTIPGSAAIGVPALYYFRNGIARRPLAASFPVAIYAALIATLLVGWTIAPTPYGARHFEVLWFYPAACGLGFVIVLGWPQFKRQL